jgi:hypothetical protein
MSTSSQSYLGASQNLVSSCSGSVQPLLSSIALFPAGAVGAGNAGTYYPIQSGQIISVPVLAQAATLTLPPVATSSGHTFTVVCRATLAFTLAITAQSACMRGFVLQPTAVGVAVVPMSSYNTGVAAGTPATTLTLAATCVAGDRVELKCDGVSWFVQGWSGLASAVPSMVFA